jgi:hypothetical protein
MPCSPIVLVGGFVPCLGERLPWEPGGLPSSQRAWNAEIFEIETFPGERRQFRPLSASLAP